jgi:outer membrane protein TolC
MKSIGCIRAFCSVLLFMTLAGCSTNYYRKSADKAAYGLIGQKSPAVMNMDTNFTIQATNSYNLSGYPTNYTIEEFLGADGSRERGAIVLGLADVLAIAVRHSREYQNRKEDLYASSLELSLARHDFTPLFSAEGRGDYIVGTRSMDTTNVFGVVTDSIVEEHTIDGSGRVDVSWLIRDIGRITAAFTLDVSKFISGNGFSHGTTLGATFFRPLLRNAGFKAEQEALKQAERDLLYAVRDFTQFRKDFSVGIATDFYNVLGSRDAARNSYLNLQSSRKNAERTRALALEGRVTTADLGRLEQQELSSESSWVNAIRNYQRALDNFKLTLGISVDVNVLLDDRELQVLEIKHPEIEVEDAIRVALAGRLDYKNVVDRVADAERRLDLREDFLKPDLDLVASAGMVSDPDDSGRFTLPDRRRYNWSAGLLFDPGLDRKGERNAYRLAMIAYDRAWRAAQLQEDSIKLDVRDSWRTLDQAKRNYEISEISVRLAERRVEEQELLSEVGRARAQDQVDAQNDLIDSRNQRTQALVNHTIARLQFWNNMGILYIKDNGQWEEVSNAQVN